MRASILTRAGPRDAVRRDGVDETLDAVREKFGHDAIVSANEKELLGAD